MTKLIQLVSNKLILLDIASKQSLVKRQDQLRPIPRDEEGGLGFLELIVFAGLKKQAMT